MILESLPLVGTEDLDPAVNHKEGTRLLLTSAMLNFIRSPGRRVSLVIRATSVEPEQIQFLSL